MTGNTGMKEFNRAMLEFFAHPGSRRGTAADYARRVLDCVLSCDVRLLIVDDLHFLQWRNSSGIAISNHFKYIANELPVTMIFIGVGLAARGLFSEGSDYQDAVLAQTGRRTTALGMEPFAVNTERGRRHWRQLLLAIEQRVVLAVICRALRCVSDCVPRSGLNLARSWGDGLICRAVSCGERARGGRSLTRMSVGQIEASPVSCTPRYV